MAGPWYIVVGGSVVDIDATYGTKTTGMFGTGMPPLTHNVSQQALTPGAMFRGLKVQPRVLQLRIQCWAASLAGFHSVRKLLVNAVKPNYGGTLAPVELRYSGAGTTVKVHGYYDSGLEGSREAGGLTNEDIVVRFVCYDPFWYAISPLSDDLNTVKAVTSADFVVRRNSGVWANISTDFNAVVHAMCCDASGNIYIGGNFSNVGDANGDHIVKYNPTTGVLSSLSTGISGNVYALLTDPNGSAIYVGGRFDNIGDANGDGIVKWSGSAWSSLSTGMGAGTVYALAMDHSGVLYIGGSFSNIGDANGDQIVAWNGSAFSSLGTGLAGGSVNALAISKANTLFVGGTFTSAGGVSAATIAQWDGAAWAAVGSGVGVAGGAAEIHALMVAPDGMLYIGGSFTSIDGVSANNIAQWNGTAWSALGIGTDNRIYTIAIDNENNIYVGGVFTSAGGSAIRDSLALWNGSVWTHVALDLPTYDIKTILTVGNDLYIGYYNSGTAYAAEQTIINNSGSAVVYPTFSFTRTGGTTARVEYLKNETTGHTLYLNYTLLDGETLTITLTPGAKSISSDFFGNVIGRALLPNSDFAEWCLLPGNNVVSLYVYQSGAPTVGAVYVFYPAHWAVDGVAA